MPQDPPVDALLIVSFGGPEHPDQVMPFLRNVTAGRNVPEERLVGVAQHYFDFGGRSPINEQNRALIAAVEARMKQRQPQLPIYWGNRNWDPYLDDAIAQMMADGRHHAAAFATSAFSSYSGCRQYREDIVGARQRAAEGAPRIHKLRQFFNHPGFIDPMVDNVRAALSQLPAEHRESAPLVFTAHSVPLSMASNSRYEQQLNEAARLIHQRVGGDHAWDLVYQSRSGPPSIPWLEPDINDHLRKLSADGHSAAVLVPVGFVSDHMEVVYDLDVEAVETAAEIDMNIARAATVGTDARFVDLVLDLVTEHIEDDPVKEALGDLGVVTCLPGDCCLSPVPTS